MPIARWRPCPGQSRSQGPALTPLDGTSPSGSFLPVVRAGSDHLKVVHPCGSRHGSQADRDPDWPLRPELAAPLGVWPSSQLTECAAGRRCAGTLLYFRAVRSTALRACSRAQLSAPLSASPNCGYVLDGDGEGQLGFTAARRSCPAVMTPLTAVTTPDTVLAPGWAARSLTDVLRVDSAELSALVWACHWPCASLTKVARAVLTLPRSAVS